MIATVCNNIYILFIYLFKKKLNKNIQHMYTSSYRSIWILSLTRYRWLSYKDKFYNFMTYKYFYIL